MLGRPHKVKLWPYSKALLDLGSRKPFYSTTVGDIAIFKSVGCPFWGAAEDLCLHLPSLLHHLPLFLPLFPSPPSVHHLFLFATIPGTVVGSMNNLARLIFTTTL